MKKINPKEDVTKYFKMWPAIWLNDPEVSLMTPACRALYCDLICLCWVLQGLEAPRLADGQPSADFGLILGQVRVTLRSRYGSVRAREWSAYGQVMAHHFILKEDGKWWNKRALQEWNNDCAARARASERASERAMMVSAAQTRTNGRTDETDALRNRLKGDQSIIGLQGSLRRHGPGQVVGLGWKRQNGGRVLWSDLGAEDLAEISALMAALGRGRP